MTRGSPATTNGDDWSDAVPNPNPPPTYRGIPAGYEDEDNSDDSDYGDDFYYDHVRTERIRELPAVRAPDPPETSEPAERFRLACVNGDMGEILKLLDVDKINIDECNKATGWSPLMVATAYGHVELVNLLIDRGANVNFRASGSGDELTPLMVTCLAPSEERMMQCLKLLLEGGAQVNVCSGHGGTALMFAAKENKLALVETLLVAGADVNAAGENQRTALELAAGLGHGRVVRVLLEHGADASHVNEFGQTAGDVAMKDHREISQILYHVITTKWKPGLAPELVDQLEEIREIGQDKPAHELMQYVERSQIEMVLENLKLKALYPKFQEHNISYLNFLTLDEEKLKDIGIGVVGDRMKIVDAIRDIHNREWVDQSVTPMYLKTDITASEVVCILNNTKKHMEYIAASVKYLRKKAKSNPSMLEAGAEQSPLHDMVKYSDASLGALSKLKTEVEQLQHVLNQLTRNAEFQTPDDISVRRGFASKWSTILGAVPATLAGIGYAFALRYRS